MPAELRCTNCGHVESSDGDAVGEWQCPSCGRIQPAADSGLRPPDDTVANTLFQIGGNGTDGDTEDASASGDSSSSSSSSGDTSGSELQAPAHDGTLFAISGDTSAVVGPAGATRPVADDASTDAPLPTAINAPTASATLTIANSHGVRADVTVGKDTTVQRLLSGADAGEPSARHVIGDEIARGGMGAILSAVDRDLRREVAMKVMLPAAAKDKERVLRFVEEAQVTGQLSHPNIVPVHELGVGADGRIYFTMKRVRGESLADVIRKLRAGDAVTAAKHPLTGRLGIFRQIGQAVAFAHSNGVLHRDLKPDNVMLGDFGEVLVMDWGLARVRGRTERHAGRLVVVTDRSASSDGTAHTLDGTVAGTPAYMSPEQAEGKVDEIDERSDVWSLGAILFEMVSLRPPFTGRSAWTIIQQVVQDAPVAPGEGEGDPPVPRELQAIVRKAMEREKADRYQSVGEMVDDVESFLDGRTLKAASYTTGQVIAKWMHRHRKAVIPSAAAAVLLLALGIWFVASTLTKNAEIQRQNEEIEQHAANLMRERDAAQQAKAAAEAAQAEEAVQRREAQQALRRANRNLAEALATRAQVAINQNDPLSATLFIARARELLDDGETLPRLRALELVCPQPLAAWVGRTRIDDGNTTTTLWFTRDCRTLLAAGTDHRVHRIDARTGSVVSTDQLRAPDAGDDGDSGFEDGRIWWSADTSRFATRVDATTIDFFDAASGDRVHRVVSDEPFTDVVVFDDSGRYAALLSGEEPARPARVHYVDLLEQEESVASIGDTQIRDGVRGVEFRPGTAMLTFAWEQSLFAWDPRQPAAQPFPTRNLEGMISSFSWHPDGHRLVMVQRDTQIHILDRMTTRHSWIESPAPVRFVAVSPDGRLFATGCTDGTVRLYDFLGEELAVLGGHQWVQSMAFSPDGQRLAVGTWSGDIVMWALRTPPDPLAHPGSQVATLSATDRHVVLGVNEWAPGPMQVVDLDTGQEAFLPGLRDELAAPAVFRPGTPWLAIPMRHRRVVRLVHTETGAVRFVQLPGAADQLAFTRDGRWLGLNMQTTAWLRLDADGAVQDVVEPQVDESVYLGVASPDGTRAAISDWDARVSCVPLVDRDDGKQAGEPLWTLDPDEPMASGLVFSPDGRRLAVASRSGLRILDAADGRLLLDLGGQPMSSGVFPFAFSPDGSMLVSGSDDSTTTVASSSNAFLRVHDATTGAELARVGGQPGNHLCALALTPDGRTLVTASTLGSVRICGRNRTDSAAEAQRWLGHELNGLELVPLSDPRAAEFAERWPAPPLDPALAGFWRAYWQMARRLRASTTMPIGTVPALRATAAAEWQIEQAHRWQEDVVAVHGDDDPLAQRLATEIELLQDVAGSANARHVFGDVAGAVQPMAEWLAANPGHPYAPRARMLINLQR